MYTMSFISTDLIIRGYIIIYIVYRIINNSLRGNLYIYIQSYEKHLVQSYEMNLVYSIIRNSPSIVIIYNT